ncbi:hypothetical protein Dsi01nite_020200 [Dactylosporangium siamense]|uniref:Uncharacterized protein n=1 Tax=Dactylosporangium siamense TaxID=685454 RepID=A0A919PHD5_9ACTN|nr:hypothetical protein Dsi01nite_020200 [Dactylosporangium siamense]
MVVERPGPQRRDCERIGDGTLTRRQLGAGVEVTSCLSAVPMFDAVDYVEAVTSDHAGTAAGRAWMRGLVSLARQAKAHWMGGASLTGT